MVLPEGFRWEKRQQYSTVADALSLDGEHVAILLDKVGGGWVARLEVQKPGIDSPLLIRQCTSYEAGKRGCEMWAIRHQARLRDEVSENISNRPRHNGVGCLGPQTNGDS
jgi:hypothetical protein